MPAKILNLHPDRDPEACELPQVYIIGVAGPSASGKTSISNHLASIIESATMSGFAQVISQDWYYKNLPEGADGDTWNWDDPESIDSELLADTLSKLRQGYSVYRPSYDYSKYTRTDNVAVLHPTPVIICEGIFMLNLEHVNEHVDCRVFIDSDVDVSIIRRIIRDVERGYSPHLTAERYLNCVKPSFEKFIKPFVENADFKVINNGHGEGALKRFLENDRSIKKIYEHIIDRFEAVPRSEIAMNKHGIL